MALRVDAVRRALALTFESAFGTSIQIATAPDMIDPLALYIGRPTIRYHEAFARGLDVMDLPVFAILPRIADQAVVDLTDLMISGTGPDSLLVVIEQDRTLDGACQSLVTKAAVSETWLQATVDLPAYHWTVTVYG